MSAKARRPWLTKFSGKSFAFFSTGEAEFHRLAVTGQGGEVVDPSGRKVDYFIYRDEAERDMANKHAKRLTKEGHAPQVIYVIELHAMIAASRDDAIAMLKGSQEDVNLWIEVLKCSDPCPDLSGAALRGIRFGQADGHFFAFGNCKMDGANLQGSEMNHATLSEMISVDMEGVRLVKSTVQTMNDCNLKNADLSKARVNCTITRCDFSGATMGEFRAAYSNFNNCIFIETELCGAEFDKCRLRRADLTSANLSRAKIIESKFRDSKLVGANLSESTLTKSDFSNCTLRKANFAGADLTGVNLQGADLTDANFNGACLLDADLSMAVIAGANFKGAKILGANLQGVDLRKAKAIDSSQTEKEIEAGPHLRNLATCLKKAGRQNITSSAVIDLGEGYADLNLTRFPGFLAATFTQYKDKKVPKDDYDAQRRNAVHSGEKQRKSVNSCLLFLARRFYGEKLRPDSIKVESNSKTGFEELERLFIAAWHELFGSNVPTEQQIMERQQSTKNSESGAWEQSLQQLRRGAAGVEQWNARAKKEEMDHLDLRAYWRKSPRLLHIDLSGCDLQGAVFRRMDLDGSSFEASNLGGARFDDARLGGVNFKKARLSKANFVQAYLVNAIFPDSNLKGCNLRSSSCRGANFQRANLKGAKFRGSDLRGADFRDATLTDTEFFDTMVDENTRFPNGFALDPSMRWLSKTRDPRMPASTNVSRPRASTLLMVKEAWDVIHKWCDQHSPPLRNCLQKPATKKAIQALETAVGFKLPDDFVESYLIHDGSANPRGEFWAPIIGLPLLSLDAIASVYEALAPPEGYEPGDHVADGPFGIRLAFELGSLKDAAANAKWLPFAGNQVPDGDYIGLDLDPGSKGTSGQVINFGFESCVRYVLAPSFRGFMNLLANLFCDDKVQLHPLVPGGLLLKGEFDGRECDLINGLPWLVGEKRP